MNDQLSGQAVFSDSGQSVLLCGRMMLASDGKGRSEIVLRSIDGAEEERLVFTSRATWVAIYQLIQVIRESFTIALAEAAAGDDPPCATCGGVGGGVDPEGNWQDCPSCD